MQKMIVIFLSKCSTRMISGAVSAFLFLANRCCYSILSILTQKAGINSGKRFSGTWNFQQPALARVSGVQKMIPINKNSVFR